MFNVFSKIKEAYECSTLSNNVFKDVLESIKWDSRFFADGEFYFVKGDFTFTTPSLDPFDMDWKPSAMFADGSIASF